MKYEDYELCISFVLPCYWYEEGMSQEIYYLDEQTCDYQHFGLEYDIDQVKNKWYKIMLYKPKGMTIKGKEDLEKCKWLVSESYMDYVDNNDTDYEKYEWDFKNHCIKL